MCLDASHGYAITPGRDTVSISRKPEGDSQ